MKKYWWVALDNGREWGFLKPNGEIGYGSYELIAARFRTKADAEEAASSFDGCVGYKIKYHE